MNTRPVTEQDIDDVQMEFLKLLALSEPDHPWLDQIRKKGLAPAGNSRASDSVEPPTHRRDIGQTAT